MEPFVNTRSKEVTVQVKKAAQKKKNLSNMSKIDGLPKSIVEHREADVLRISGERNTL